MASSFLEVVDRLCFAPRLKLKRLGIVRFAEEPSPEGDKDDDDDWSDHDQPAELQTETNAEVSIPMIFRAFPAR